MSRMLPGRLESSRPQDETHAAVNLGARRILVVGHTYALRVNQQKLDALAGRCGALGLLVPSNWANRDGLYQNRRIAPERGYDSFKIFEARVLRAGHAASFVFDPVALVRVLAEFRADLIHVDQEVYSLASAQLAAAARMAGAKLVVFGWENLDRPLHPIQRVARRVVLSLADALVCGNSEGARLFQKWGFRRRIEVIPQLGVDPQMFHPGLRRREGPFTIGFVGRLVREKGVDLLLEALAALARKGFDFEAAICGAGRMEGELRKLARKLGVEGRVRWPGATAHHEVPETMSRFDVLVLPSRQASSWKEQFGHVLIEAMSMGIPVVGSSSGAIPEVIGRQDLVFPEEDAAALARILERLMTNEGWRREAGDYGIARVRQSYTHEKIAERLTKLWADILTTSRCWRPQDAGRAPRSACWSSTTPTTGACPFWIAKQD
jgi:glycosyltransferase involved in cell wall biosynthesis